MSQGLHEGGDKLNSISWPNSNLIIENISDIQSFALPSHKRLESFVDSLKLYVASMLSSDFIKDCEVVRVVMTIFGFQMNLVEPIMVALLEQPHFSDAWLEELSWNFVFYQVLGFFEVE